MSLQVWLPLTDGTLKNQGLGTITNITNTPTYKSYGKVGSKAFDLKSNRVTMNCASLGNLKTFSVCFWGMTETSSLTTDWQDLIGFTDVSASGSNGTFRWETCYNSSSTGIHWHDNTTGALSSNSRVHTRDRGIWHHCCVVFDYSTLKIHTYTDGVLIGTDTHQGGSFNAAGTFYIGEKDNIEGCVQDVRFYDHALSPKEVKEISKGLILHYTLDQASSDNVEYDCSGFGNDGITTAAPILATGSPRYSKCYKFDTAAKYIDSSTNLDGSYTDYSLSYWENTPSFSTNIPVCIGGGNLNIYNGVSLNSEGNGNSNPIKKDGVNTTAPSTGVWHHWVISSTSSSITVYLDGVIHGTAMAKSITAGKMLRIHHYGGGVSYNTANAQISDVRLYMTALTAEDALELYNTGAIVNNNGSTYAYEYVETSSGNNQVQKTGIMNSQAFEESSTIQAKVYNTKIETSEFLEI